MISGQSGFTLGALFSKMFRAPVMPQLAYNPGWQPNSPGNSSTPGWVGGMVMHPIPWPNMVPTLNAMASNPGIPRGRPIAVDVNLFAPLFINNMFIAGYSGKSMAGGK